MGKMFPNNNHEKQKDDTLSKKDDTLSNMEPQRVLVWTIFQRDQNADSMANVRGSLATCRSPSTAFCQFPTRGDGFATKI